ncbi:MAG: hypothetical protein HY720_30700 [Planctomycetes bacterium]|nr:hypothetical protein [Planctomycetota bacterium]
MRQIAPLVAAGFVLLVLPGCVLISWAADLAAAAAPYLLFFVEAGDEPGTPPGEPPDPDREVLLALAAAGDPSRPLPDGTVLLDEAVRKAPGERLLVLAVPAPEVGAEEDAIELYRKLRRENGSVEVAAADVGPLLESAGGARQIERLSDEGLVLLADGPLSTLAEGPATGR